MRTLFDAPPGEVTARPYQVEAADAVFGEFRKHDSTLVVMATGLGKTVLFGLIARDWLADRPGESVIVFAHREELITQARDELAGILGFQPDVEMGDRYADPVARCVVASVQSCHPRRLTRFDPARFTLCVWDEAHHKVKRNRTYWRVREHFGRSKHLGVTATARRSDKVALGESFESVAYELGIAEAVAEGWLVRPRQQFIQVESLDLSAVSSAGGDFDRRQLAAALTHDERTSWQVAAAVAEHCGDGPTLIFSCPRPPVEAVSQGRQIADALNSMRPGSAVFLTGEDAPDDRRRQLRRYEGRDFQYLVGCSLFTEGFNSVGISRVVMARPTQSEVYYTQCVGRGTRTLRGVLAPDLDTADARLSAIAASDKPDLLVLDFVGNSGRHKLVSCVDIFAGTASPEVRRRAAAKAKRAGGPVDVRTLLAEAAEEERRVKARVGYTATDVDPFGGSDVGGRAATRRKRSDAATPGQRQRVKQMGGVLDKNATIADAGRVLAECQRRFREGLCSPKQEAALKRNGMADGPVPRHHAKALLDLLAARHWTPPGYALERGRLSIAPAAEGGFRLVVSDPTAGKVQVGPAFATVADVRAAYRGLAAEPSVA